jgi:hypothetical protein
MMKPATSVLGLAALSLSGCGENSPSQNVTQIRVANPHSDQLKELPEQLRHLGLMRALRDSGRRCQRVEAGAYQEEYSGMAMWVALCNDGRHWAIFIAPNADIQVRQCTEMDTLDLPQCRPVAGASGSGQQGS